MTQSELIRDARSASRADATIVASVGGVVGVSIAAAGDELRLVVSDSGIGISADALPHVFERFVQEEHATDFNGVGLGIGLAVVCELVRAHGGSVQAQSAGLGQGSRFVVTLPLRSVARCSEMH